MSRSTHSLVLATGERVALTIIALAASVAGALAAVVVPAGTTLFFHLNAPISSGTSKTNEPFAFTMLRPIVVGGATVVRAGAQGTGTLLLAGHAGSSGHEGDLTLRLDTVATTDGATLRFHDQQIRLNGRNRKVESGVLGFVPFVGIGARFIRGEESIISPSTEIRTVLAAEATTAEQPEARP